ncbi:acyl-CoA dehydrogenase [Erythrobacteraceae bacterium CFH 75059]|uniref:acyl-CoA dehydrogenase family protein n=1 Tax=Qipengyuania thermophila TaxID=2509361 RepID=UPI00101FA588|nr:acyl-CoA dehydrogenase family protein [Qipengyuania thermophila]TCD04094.1 acyl-CoA dehydrogenase [Erythrobacteraceae bacterium CFH 75059]
MDQETFTILLDTVRRFVDERLIPAEDEVEETDAVPEAIVAEMRALGLFGLSIPEEYGGLGLSMSEEVQVVFELGRAAAAFRSTIGTTVGIGSQGIVIDGTPEQKRAWLPKLAAGMVSSFALTEPDAGSDAASLTTTATRDGEEYVLNGTKRYITNARRAGMLTVMARSERDVKGAAGVSAFIVPADAPGLSFGPPDRKMGQRGTVTSDVVFDDVRVPAANLIGGVPGRGLKTAFKVLDRGRIHLSAAASGTAHRLVAESVAYAAARKQFGQPVAAFQLVQGLIADSHTDALAAWCMTRDVARRYDAGEPVSRDVAATKYFASEALGRVADRAVQVHGGAGYMAEYKVERFYRDVRLMRIYEGTSQIQQTIIARHLLRDAGLAI